MDLPCQQAGQPYVCVSMDQMIVAIMDNQQADEVQWTRCV